ncbi:uncharacterized protein lrrc41 [Syngnathus typhle]|uniref:uncharacterized protein lrrc41 n=1 Tax=Syngnathus typhle TaxID=161592 RepID=UPI002A69D36C|nr:uncharacterized protein lrrc41 [Syngnathus typhle]
MCSLKSTREEQIRTLRGVCLEAVHYHFSFKKIDAAAILSVPADLLQDLLPYMNPCQLDQLQPELERKGVSTYSAWMKIYQRLAGRETRFQQKTFDTSQEVKVEVMQRMFAQWMFAQRLRRPYVDLDIWNHMDLPTFLSTAVKYVKHVTLSSDMELAVNLTAGDPLLSSLEKTVESLKLEWTDSSTSRDLDELFTFLVHRFLDHGVVKHVSVNSAFGCFLTWLFYDRDHVYKTAVEQQRCLINIRYDSEESMDSKEFEDENGPPAKHLKTDKTVSLRFHCCEVSYPGCVTPCPVGKIQSLTVTDCNLDMMKELVQILPTLDSLTTLTLELPFLACVERDLTILLEDTLTTALASLSSRPRRCLRRVSIPSMQCTEDLLFNLLQAYLELKELHVGAVVYAYKNKKKFKGELELEHLSVNLYEDQRDAKFLLTVLRVCPRLVSLHISGMRLPTGHSLKELLNTLTESNILLTSLSLLDLNLSDCLEEIIKLLSVCKLEELHLKDCRLLDCAVDKAESLRQLVDALKTLPSLRKLTLSHNRLAKDVHVLAQLFSGPAPSSLEYLHVGANFIQPADLLLLAEALSSHPPQRQLTLDLTTNPGDRDVNTWKAALDKLRPFCRCLTNEWNSKNTMADYISNM